MRKNTFTLKSNILYPKRNALAFIAPTAESNKWWEEEVPSMSRVKHASSALPSPGQYAVSSKPERSRARSEAAHRRCLPGSSGAGAGAGFGIFGRAAIRVNDQRYSTGLCIEYRNGDSRGGGSTRKSQ